MVEATVTSSRTMNKDRALICPVCSLYLHQDVLLIDHLSTHSKGTVAELLWSSPDGDEKGDRDFHRIDVEEGEYGTTCSFIYGTPPTDADPAFARGCDNGSVRSEHFENILIVIIVVAVIILYLRM